MNYKRDKPLGVLYRVIETVNSDASPLADVRHGCVLGAYEVVRETPRGVVVSVCGREKRVRTTAGRPWARVEPKEAWTDYLARKERQRGVLAFQLGVCRRRMGIAERKLKEAGE